MIGTKQIVMAALGVLLLLPHAHANSIAIFRTSFGEMAVELFDEDKPVTVRNFMLLERFGAYRNTFFHRNYISAVAQGGGYSYFNPSSTSLVTAVNGVFSFGPITNEYLVGPVYSNVYGTIAMARSGTNLNSATSQWFFNLVDNSVAFGTNNDNGPYTVFGRVIQGTNVLEAFRAQSLNDGIVNAGAPFSELPVTYSGSQPPHYNELIYAGIEMMMIQISPVPDGRLLEWNSPSTLVCRVEYTDTDADNWDTLYLTNGNGTIQGVIDTNTAAINRKYRIRVE